MPLKNKKRVKKPLKRQKNTFEIGVLKKSRGEHWFLQPLQRGRRPISVENPKKIDLQEGMVAKIMRSEQIGKRKPSASVEKILATVKSVNEMWKLAVLERQIPEFFPEHLLKSVQNEKKFFRSACHEDWTSLDFITIDPADAKDMDDAVYACRDDAPDNRDGFILFVAIADFALYVEKGSALDKEALARSHSIYFPSHVIPMLPHALCDDLCSLKAGCLRPVLAVKIRFNRKGQKISCHFHRAKIKVRKNFSYPQVEDIINNAVPEKLENIDAPLLQVIRNLWHGYQLISKNPDKAEPLHLLLPERKIIFDAQGNVQDIVTEKLLQSHKLIEEFMIQANICAAQQLEESGKNFLYRVHPEPPKAKQEVLIRLAHMLQLPWCPQKALTPKAINQILMAARETELKEVVSQFVLRAQSQAQYQRENIGHFGLYLTHYTHFTSPIRRYADLLVHRALLESLQLEEKAALPTSPHSCGELDAIAIQISENEKRSLLAERITFDRIMAHFLQDKLFQNFQAFISGVNEVGLFISLANYGAQGFIPMASLGRFAYKVSEENTALVNRKSKKGYQIGDEVEARLLHVEPWTGSMKFKMLTPPRNLQVF